MTIHSYVADQYIDDIAFYAPEEQYRLLYDLPDGRLIAPEVSRRIFLNGEKTSEALKPVRCFLPTLFGPNPLSPESYGAPNLIDEERWDKARDKARAELRSRGVMDPG